MSGHFRAVAHTLARTVARTVARTLANAGLLLGLLLPGSGHAFYVDGFWSGMSAQQLAATARTYGLVAWPGMAGQWFIGTHLPPRVIGEFGFCGNYLVSYSRDIHADADYASTLAAIFATYGPPRNMSFSGDMASGGTAGEFRAAGATLWSRGPDRVKMNSMFDWRMNQGNLQREQPARVKYETRNPCSSL